MSKNYLSLIFFVASGLVATNAYAHNHATVDTQHTALGKNILVRAGYLGSERSYTIDADRRLRYNGQPATYHLPEVQKGGAFDGWYTHQTDLLILTSDFFYASGRLGSGWDGLDYKTPGDFLYEIVEVTPVGASPTTHFAHVKGSNRAVSNASDQAGRSFHAGVGNHEHNQRMFIEHAGTYDVRYRVWDSTGQFATDTSVALVSDVVVRVTVPEPGVLTLALPVFAAMAMRRRRR